MAIASRKILSAESLISDIHYHFKTIPDPRNQKEMSIEELHQKAHTIIAATLISLALVVEPIEIQDSQPSSLIEAMKNAYLSIRSLFPS